MSPQSQACRVRPSTFGKDTWPRIAGSPRKRREKSKVEKVRKVRKVKEKKRRKRKAKEKEESLPERVSRKESIRVRKGFVQLSIST